MKKRNTLRTPLVYVDAAFMFGIIVGFSFAAILRVLIYG